jgi:hypothetical protein
MQPGSLVFLNDRKYLKHLGKIHMHWLGPFFLLYISEVEAAMLATL